ncbi:MAG: Cobalamin biosynthesis protein CbiB [Candidatus Izimaplasma bacterium HR2]|nr:MAG: Cobalamin biosynthesis protein CbiB [Candidatus Izimaplasma bacterium HR2]
MIIVIAYGLDLILGDPFPFHPVILIGRLITYIEKKIYRDSVLSGLILFILVQTIIILFIYMLRQVLFEYLVIVLDIYIIYSLFATKSLYIETKKVTNEIKKQNIEGARKSLSYLVSRDISELEYEEINKALIETISENTIDGVLAPIMFAFIGLYFDLAVEFLLFYKITSTLDSMVGYKNDKYSKFGYTSAKTDDILNFIPSRIGSIIMLLSGIFVGNIKTGIFYFFKDRKNNNSPNAGHPESVIAGLFEIELQGDGHYFGQIVHKAKIGINKNKITVRVVNKTYFVMFLSSLITMIILGGLYYEIF